MTHEADMKRSQDLLQAMLEEKRVDSENRLIAVKNHQHEVEQDFRDKVLTGLAVVQTEVKALNASYRESKVEFSVRLSELEKNGCGKSSQHKDWEDRLRVVEFATIQHRLTDSPKEAKEGISKRSPFGSLGYEKGKWRLSGLVALVVGCILAFGLVVVELVKAMK